jgi:hypothetical protein
MGSRDTASDKQSGKSKLSPDGMKVVKFIHETVLNIAKAPTVGEIQAAIKKPEKDVIQALEELERNDILIRRHGTQEIVNVYPFSLVLLSIN